MKRSAQDMRKAIKAMLELNYQKQQGRHKWEWFVQWLDGWDAPIPEEGKDAGCETKEATR